MSEAFCVFRPMRPKGCLKRTFAARSGTIAALDKAGDDEGSGENGRRVCLLLSFVTIMASTHLYTDTRYFSVYCTLKTFQF